VTATSLLPGSPGLPSAVTPQHQQHMAAQFCEPRSFPFRVSPEELGFIRAHEPDGAQRHLAAGTISVEARGLGFQLACLRVTVANLSGASQRVIFPRGSYFHCTDPVHQPLITVSTKSATIDAGARRMLTFDAYCACGAYYSPAGHTFELSGYVLDHESAMASQESLWSHTDPHVKDMPASGVNEVASIKANAERQSVRMAEGIVAWEQE
jgi:hypothetical protein